MKYIILFIAGSFLASFAYCVSYDWVHQQIKFSRRSRCPHCRRVLTMLDLIPIFSQFFSASKCRYCHHSISSAYFISEIFGGLFFILSYYLFAEYSILYSFNLTLIVLFMIFCDLHALIVPDLLQLLLLLLILSLLYVSNLNFIVQLANALFVIFILLLINFTKPASIGGADIKTISILSLLIPISLLPYFIFIMSTSGLIYYYIRKIFLLETNHPIPFIPFIFIAFYSVSIYQLFL